jgi:ring-1,2-phenylacetyl-CoA epoxidase subunit PaaD
MERLEQLAAPPGDAAALDVAPEREGGGDEAPLACPWCGSVRVEKVAAFGSHLMVAQYLCLQCRSPFERIRKR